MNKNVVFSKKCKKCTREFETKNKAVQYCSKRCEYPDKASWVKK